MTKLSPTATWAFFGLLASLVACSDKTSTSLPKGCEEVLSFGDATADGPRCQPEALCAELARRPSKLIAVDVFVDKTSRTDKMQSLPFDSPERTFRQTCVAALLKGRGFDPDTQSAGAKQLGDVMLTEVRISDVIEALKGVPLVGYIEVSCGNSKDCVKACMSLDASQCSSDVFCHLHTPKSGGAFCSAPFPEGQ